MIDELKSRLRRVPINASQVGEGVERASRIFFQQHASFADGRSLYIDRHLVAIELDTFDNLRIPGKQPRDRGVILELFHIGDGGRQGH